MEAEAARAKALRQADKEESARSITEAAQLLLVELRMKYESRFTNTSDTADAVWAHIHADYTAAIDDGTLHETDARTAEQLTKRYATELGEFRLWCAVANRAIEDSGVPRDEVEEKVRAH